MKFFPCCCSWKAEVYISKIYDSGALKEATIVWRDVTSTEQTKTFAMKMSIKGKVTDLWKRKNELL